MQTDSRKYKHIIEIALYLAVNAIFIIKYVPRAGLSPWLAVPVWCAGALLCLWLVARYVMPSERLSKVCVALLTSAMIGLIGIALWHVEPLTLRVDRWSATSYFLDALFQHQYPYDVHTHVSQTNYPSPLPMWQYINIPFWMMGDVGWQLVFFLLLTVLSVYAYTRSWSRTLMFTALFALAPAYWWEVAVRSDGLSNIQLAFCLILLIDKQHICFERHLWALVVICALVAMTRLSAVIPFAIYLFRPFVSATWQRKATFLLSTTLLCLLVLMPYILWDTTSWIFFSRNPFMEQTAGGNLWTLMIFVVLGVAVAWQWRSIEQYAGSVGVFLFAFMLCSVVANYYAYPQQPFFDNPHCDISYLTLSLPFLAFSMCQSSKFYVSK